MRRSNEFIPLLHMIFSNDPIFSLRILRPDTPDIVTAGGSQLQARTNYHSVSSTICFSFRSPRWKGATDRTYPGTAYSLTYYTISVGHGPTLRDWSKISFTTAHLLLSQVRLVFRFLHTLSLGRAKLQQNYSDESYKQDKSRTTLLNINIFLSLRIYRDKDISMI